MPSYVDPFSWGHLQVVSELLHVILGIVLLFHEPLYQLTGCHSSDDGVINGRSHGAGDECEGVDVGQGWGARLMTVGESVGLSGELGGVGVMTLVRRFIPTLFTSLGWIAPDLACIHGVIGG